MTQAFANLHRSRLAGAVAWVTLCGQTAPLFAASFNFSDSDWVLDLDTTLSYAAQWRVAPRKDSLYDYRQGDTLEDLTAKVNADDGDRNFDRGSMVQNKASIVVDMDLNWRNYGAFVRGRAWYDQIYHQRTDQDERGLLTYNSGELYGGDAAPGEFPRGTRDAHGSAVEFLDYFLYATWDLPGARLFDARVGAQVINWGESTFYQGINSLQNRIDTIAANSPGTEVKEILLPTGAVYGQIDLVSNVTFEAYYQYEWLRTELNGVGSYFSTVDWLGPGSENFLVAAAFDPDTGEPTFIFPVPQGETRLAKDSGQYGIALHWVTQGGTDFGFYYVNQHSKTPGFTINRVGIFPTDYDIFYFEDIKGYAASFTTVWGITNMQGEVSYKTDVPVVDRAGNFIPANVAQLQLGGSHVFQPNKMWQSANLTFELAGADITSESAQSLRFDSRAYGYAARFEMLYFNVAQGLDLSVPLFLQHGLRGTYREANLSEDTVVFNIALKAIYLNTLVTQLGYSNYFGAGDDNLLQDRDNIAFTVSYSF